MNRLMCRLKFLYHKIMKAFSLQKFNHSHYIYLILIHYTQHDTGRELDAASACQQLGIRQWFYVSAKTGENVETAFECLIRQVSNYIIIEFCR